jgi:hypothetical protein
MSDFESRFYLYKGYKIYEPILITGFNGKKYWNYKRPEISSYPMSGYPTKETYYKAQQKKIDERVTFGHWTDNFGTLIK